MAPDLRIDLDRLMGRLRALGEIGALPGGGVKRLALSDADKAGRDLVCGWMRDLGLDLTTDCIGNVWGVRRGREDTAPVVIGSHIDTVATGGLYDGNLGVLAGLEIVETLNDAGIETRRPVAVGFFTNEEGARFAPDMMGSGVAQGALDLDDTLATVGIDGQRVGDELRRIGYAGDAPPLALKPDSFLELHVEQGPVLEREGIAIGAVTGVQGISWTEFTVTGVSNHAGTTPMAMRHDAGVVAARIALEARAIADAFGPPQVATVGAFRLEPDLVNVVPQKAVLTVDLRNTDNVRLIEAETRLRSTARKAAAEEGCTVELRSLARFDPVEFDEGLVAAIETAAAELGHGVRRMPSGAGHDAQMFAPNCPTAMVFVPSQDGLSHNINEYTAPEEIRAGVDVLFRVALARAGADILAEQDQ
ncbi:Zn-dependent hydrolase [Limimaricola hongkongensis]|uniref:Beta-ureidopropionase n=1 Tax=Limimaricola hongkongensis DSM 17492 TaxID=1122180 RepID=A0A017HFP5_9RHOB|nr:Zn-dependent hydrolase [Limimaricola hongkongensis]EYD73120.1 Beta-ureidopropionase [Limimaricola hongkongensis DSM 17492]